MQMSGLKHEEDDIEVPSPPWTQKLNEGDRDQC